MIRYTSYCLLPCLILIFAQRASAQIQYPYTISFETSVMTPATQTHQATDTVIANGLKWIMPGTYYGPGDANDFKTGNQSARIRLTNDATGAPGSMYMAEDIPFGLHYVQFDAALYNGEGDIGKLLVYYSQNQGATWIPFEDTFVIPVHSPPTPVYIHDHIMGDVRLKIQKVDNNNSRINIDNFYFSPMGAPPEDTLFYSFKTPEGNIVHPVNTNSIRMVFNQHIDLNTGEFRLHRVGGNVQVFNVQSSPNISISSDTLIVSNVALLPDAVYYITFDADAIISQYHGPSVKTAGITSDTTWRFSTTPIIFNHIDEKFDSCGNDGILGVFRQHNAYGVYKWECTDVDTLDTLATLPYVSMHGSSSNRAFENIDFLITNLPLDLNSEIARFSFREKRNGFGNNVKRSVSYSTNFTGNPYSAHWIKLDNQDLPEIIHENKWQSFNYEMFSGITSKPFYLCFQYESESNLTFGDAWKWALDDIRLVSSLSNENILNNNRKLHLTVMGLPSKSEADIRVSVAKDEILNIEIYDLNGRKVYTDTHRFVTGTQLYRAGNLNLQSGMYLVRMSSENCTGSVKMVVR